MNKALEISNKYDEFGIPKYIPRPDIKKGDKVCYFDVERIDKKLVRIPLYGIWDGEKAEFEHQKTVVRTTRWLFKVN